LFSFQEQYELAQQISGVSDAANTAIFKRAINWGGQRFMAILGRPWNKQSRFADVVADQQYYQLPEDAVRPTEVIVSTGTTGVWVPLIEVADETMWRLMNQSSPTGNPTHYYVRGNDEIGLYPTPSAAVTSGLELVFEPRHLLLTKDDFTTGTVTVTNGGLTVTNSAANFTADMVGRKFQITDGTDGNSYRVQSFTDTSNLVLENYYQGTSGAGKTYRIGEQMNIPEEFLQAPVDYAMHRHYLRRGDKQEAADFRALFESDLETCQSLYGQASSNQIIYSDRAINVYNPLIDTPNSIMP
jgi:hypothetical protein